MQDLTAQTDVLCLTEIWDAQASESLSNTLRVHNLRAPPTRGRPRRGGGLSKITSVLSSSHVIGEVSFPPFQIFGVSIHGIAMLVAYLAPNATLSTLQKFPFHTVRLTRGCPVILRDPNSRQTV